GEHTRQRNLREQSPPAVRNQIAALLRTLFREFPSAPSPLGVSAKGLRLTRFSPGKPASEGTLAQREVSVMKSSRNIRNYFRITANHPRTLPILSVGVVALVVICGVAAAQSPSA